MDAKTLTELSSYKEEFQTYILSKEMENLNFYENTLTAGKTNLSYNTQKEGETGNIKTIIPSLTDEYFEKMEVVKGKLYIKTTNQRIIKIAKAVGIEPNPYDITDEGRLLSSTNNLLLMDETGTITIPDSVTAIGEGAFSNMSGLKTIIIPGSVTEIENNAFSNNTTLENVIIQDGVKIIGESAFMSCSGLKNVDMPNSIVEIGQQAFRSCNSLEGIELSDELSILQYRIFFGCTSLENIKLPIKLQKIYESAFEGCTKIDNITLTSMINSINAESFKGCTNLQNITVETNSYIYENGILTNSSKNNILFISTKYFDSVDTFEIPNGVTSFTTSISTLENIKNIVVPISVTSISASSLPKSIENITVETGNTNLEVNNKFLYNKTTMELIYAFSKETNITVLSEIKIIGTNAFKGCTNCTSISLPNNLEMIRNFGLRDLTKCTEINIGKVANSISNLFLGENYTPNVSIDSENPNYCIENNIFYNKDKTILKKFLYRIIGDYTTPEGVKTIERYAFYGQHNLTTLTINEGCETLDRESIFYCNVLTKVVIPNTVNAIGEKAFSENRKLTQILLDKPQNSISGSPWGATGGEKVVIWDARTKGLM